MDKLSAVAIAALHDERNRAWHSLQEKHPPTTVCPDPLAEAPAEVVGDLFMSTVAAQHLANFRLWHVEDLARVPSAADREIAGAKRAIDRINQQRNDLTERLDSLLFALQPAARPAAELLSETPGMMIDRLSILSLKLYHTREEIERADAPAGHAARNRERWIVLEAQRGDLADCLDRLWHSVLVGERRFRVYRQLKMYNDPNLNPALYRERQEKGRQGEVARDG